MCSFAVSAKCTDLFDRLRWVGKSTMSSSNIVDMIDVQYYFTPFMSHLLQSYYFLTCRASEVLIVADALKTYYKYVGDVVMDKGVRTRVLTTYRDPLCLWYPHYHKILCMCIFSAILTCSLWLVVSKLSIALS